MSFFPCDIPYMCYTYILHMYMVRVRLCFLLFTESSQYLPYILFQLTIYYFSSISWCKCYTYSWNRLCFLFHLHFSETPLKASIIFFGIPSSNHYKHTKVSGRTGGFSHVKNLPAIPFQRRFKAHVRIVTRYP